jgi:hypothetical protein
MLLIMLLIGSWGLCEVIRSRAVWGQPALSSSWRDQRTGPSSKRGGASSSSAHLLHNPLVCSDPMMLLWRPLIILQAIYLMLLSPIIGVKFADVPHSTAVANLCYYYVPVLHSSTRVWSYCIMDVLTIGRTRCRHTAVDTAVLCIVQLYSCTALLNI